MATRDEPRRWMRWLRWIGHEGGCAGSEQLGLEVEGLDLDVQDAELGGVIVNHLAQALHVDDGGHLDLGTRIAVLAG